MEEFSVLMIDFAIFFVNEIAQIPQVAAKEVLKKLLKDFNSLFKLIGKRPPHYLIC